MLGTRERTKLTKPSLSNLMVSTCGKCLLHEIPFLAILCDCLRKRSLGIGYPTLSVLCTLLKSSSSSLDHFWYGLRCRLAGISFDSRSNCSLCNLGTSSERDIIGAIGLEKGPDGAGDGARARARVVIGVGTAVFTDEAGEPNEKPGNGDEGIPPVTELGGEVDSA